MASLASVEVVAFDIDGVLVEPKFATVLPDLLSRSPSEIAQFFAGPFEQCLLGRADLLAELPVVLKHWEWQGSVEQFVEFWFGVESTVNQAMLEFADALRANGIRCILASTQERHRARSLEALLGVGTRFERAFFSCDIGLKKPNPQFFTAVANTMNLLPGRFGLIDDVAANVESAQSVGWKGAVFRIGGNVESVAEALGVRFAA
jgi:putative hydrolase of the HAD superfamily